MTTRLIEHILEAEAMAEETRSWAPLLFLTNQSEKTIKNIMAAIAESASGAIIRVPRDFYWQPVLLTRFHTVCF